MSTKISHGYRLKPGIDPFAFITHLRQVMDPARDRADAKLLAGLYAEAVDNAWFAGKPIEEHAGYTAWRQWHLEQSKMTAMDRAHDPNEFGIELGRDDLTGGYYLLLITYNEDLRDAFEAMDEIEEYGYWDDTDSYPDGVTRADWKVRKALWDRLIPRTGRTNLVTFNLRHPSDRGVRRLLGGDGQDTTAVFDLLPSDHERAKAVTGNAYGSYLHREQGIDVMDAVMHVGFGRGADLAPVIGVAAAHLPAVTPELVTLGSRGAVIDPGYADAMNAACAALYELDKDLLEKRR